MSCFLDIDECKNATRPCHANATCTNTEGSYFCKCFSGYDGDGENCTGMYILLSFLHGEGKYFWIPWGKNLLKIYIQYNRNSWPL